MKPENVVKLVEVGPRDGLQSAKLVLHPHIRAKYIDMLIDSGIRNIEIGSFVSKKVPQMQQTDEVVRLINKKSDVNLIALVPNKQYALNAIQSGVTELAVFTTISEQFSMKNSNCTIDQSLRNIRKVVELSKEYNIPVRGYISCAFGCPYEGSELNYPYYTRTLSKYLIGIGCSSISIADTIGTATPKIITSTLNLLLRDVDPTRIGIHLHDTYGNAIENMKTCVEMGIRTFDCASGGLGGCPFAKGAPGNIATEKAIDLLDSLNLYHGVDKEKVILASNYIYRELNPLAIMEINKAKL